MKILERGAMRGVVGMDRQTFTDTLIAASTAAVLEVLFLSTVLKWIKAQIFAKTK
jgi:hypothetical protein